MRPLAHVVLGFVVLMYADAATASVDCAKASQPLEKLICSDDRLSALDEHMAEAFDKSMRPLSATGKEILRSGQEAWLRFLRTVCSTPDPERAKICTGKGYRSRMEDLEAAGVRVGPIVLNRRDEFWALKDDADSKTGVYPGFFTSQIATPLIDQPAGTPFRLWSADLDSDDGQGHCDNPNNDYLRDLWITFASNRLLIISYGESWYCHGTPHGNYQAAQTSFVPEIPPRKLELRDLFGNGGLGIQYLEEKIRSHLSEDIKRSIQMHFGPIPTQSIRVLVTSVNPSKDGLELDYRFGYQKMETFDFPMKVSWQEVLPFLVHDSPIPLEWQQ